MPWYKGEGGGSWPRHVLTNVPRSTEEVRSLFAIPVFVLPFTICSPVYCFTVPIFAIPFLFYCFVFEIPFFVSLFPICNPVLAFLILIGNAVLVLLFPTRNPVFCCTRTAR